MFLLSDFVSWNMLHFTIVKLLAQKNNNTYDNGRTQEEKYCPGLSIPRESQRVRAVLHEAYFMVTCPDHDGCVRPHGKTGYCVRT
jgi:hypothetical protein